MKNISVPVKEEINKFSFLIVLKGKAKSRSRVPAGPSARESPEEFTRTYVTCWEIARWAHTHIRTYTYTGHSG